MVGSGASVLPWPILREGQRVSICGGAMDGLEGILVRDKLTRLVLSVSLLQRSVAVEIDRAWVSPLQTYRTF